MSEPNIQSVDYSFFDRMIIKLRHLSIRGRIGQKIRKLADLIDSDKDNNYIKHAERELVAIGYDLNDKEEGPNKWIMENIFELLQVFGRQGHSGSSAPYCIDMFKKLASFEPLAPLTGEDNEWVELKYDDDICYQNKRCSHVFKDKDGMAYDIDGKVFREPNGCCYTSIDSRVYIYFPYTPKTEYVDVEADV